MACCHAAVIVAAFERFRRCHCCRCCILLSSRCCFECFRFCCRSAGGFIMACYRAVVVAAFERFRRCRCCRCCCILLFSRCCYHMSGIISCLITHCRIAVYGHKTVGSPCTRWLVPLGEFIMACCRAGVVAAFDQRLPWVCCGGLVGAHLVVVFYETVMKPSRKRRSEHRLAKYGIYINVLLLLIPTVWKLSA